MASPPVARRRVVRCLFARDGGVVALSLDDIVTGGGCNGLALRGRRDGCVGGTFCGVGASTPTAVGRAVSDCASKCCTWRDVSVPTPPSHLFDMFTCMTGSITGPSGGDCRLRAARVGTGVGAKGIPTAVGRSAPSCPTTWLTCFLVSVLTPLSHMLDSRKCIGMSSGLLSASLLSGPCCMGFSVALFADLTSRT